MDDKRRKLVGDILGVSILAFTLFLVVSLFSYNHSDPSFNSYLSGGTEVQNKAGIVGASIADFFAQATGVSAWLLALGIGYLGALIISGASAVSIVSYLAGLALITVTGSSLTNMLWSADPLFDQLVAGGLVGKFMAQKAVLPWFGPYGSYIIFVLAALLSVLVMFRLSVASAVRLGARFGWIAQEWMVSASRIVWRLMASVARIRPPLILDRSDEGKSIRDKKARIMEKEFSRTAELEADIELMDDENIPAPPPPKIVDFDLKDDAEVKLPPPPAQSSRAAAKGKKKEPEETFQQEIFEFGKGAGDYEFPSLKLLDYEAKVTVKQSKEDLIKSSRILEKKLMDFGIEGRVTQVLPGPVITIFEFEPAPGVKVSRIVSLADDLAMSLRAMSIRVVAPIPGKSVVGIEVPNLSREPVFLKEILASEEFLNDSARIPLALGKDVSGKPQVADLASVPHLLIAGSTGSGKSVGINTMICSILFRLTPSEAKFIMIDPKMLELSIYDGIPHLIAPVVTNPKKASNALRWVVGEMERRYALLSEMGVRNIDGFNRLVEEKGLTQASRPKAIKPAEDADDDDIDSEPKALEKLPYIVVVIDELADLMMVASKDVEDSLARLAQMARAAGIHLIVATQRPSVDVLTGLIKANFPARISFQVRSRVDSRTIIDSMGAEKLLGKGDMLYLPPGDAKLSRIQGPFVSDAEIHRVVNFLKSQSKPEYNEEILKAPVDEEGGEALEEDMDEFYDQAVDLVARTRQVSISMIQRRLRIGYNRAARIVEVMEKQGLVGPADGMKPREVFVRPVDDMEPQYN